MKTVDSFDFVQKTSLGDCRILLEVVFVYSLDLAKRELQLFAAIDVQLNTFHLLNQLQLFPHFRS